MGIRALCAAAAVVVGVGSAAEAATTVNYDIQLRYDGTVYTDVALWAHDPSVADLYLDSMALEGNPYGVTGRFSHLQIGDIVRFVAQVIYPDDPESWSGIYDNGGRADYCTLAGYDCSNLTMTFPGSDFHLHYMDTIGTQGTTKVGGIFEQWFWGPAVPDQLTSYGGFHAWFETASFTVVSVDNPAPVPLPAAAALLPLGLGALALMRRRRRVS
ncbi:VPLPA-CTERM sorting domain-containing protein [Paracoccus sp. 22332]|uniref:VPLPA-CTERM sorting domain-containing protein n=1 Tax=Paracoccus sp. 22332 TaxID=3453913 RepID=UPI003F877AAF